MHQTVNLLPPGYVGSNPTRPTKFMKQWFRDNWFKFFIIAILVLIIFLIARSIYLHPERYSSGSCTDNAECFKESAKKQAELELLGKCRRGELSKQLCKKL